MLNILTGEPASLSYTIPKEYDYASQFSIWSNNFLKNNKTINPSNLSQYNNEYQKQIGKTSTTATLNKTELPKLVGSAFNTVNNTLNSLLPQAEDTASQVGSGVLNAAGSIANSIPGGQIVGLGLQGLSSVINLLGPNVKGNTDKELTDQSSSYGGLDKLEDKKFGLFGWFGSANKYKNKVLKREQQRTKSEDILKTAKENQLASTGSIQNMSNYYNLMMSGGWNQNNGIRFGKQGTKLYDLSFAHKVLNLRNTIKFESGGKMNIIPEGALHARKHNINDPSLDGNITKKGIPVIANNGGEINQVAEIEREEIIFSKKVTEELEKLRDIGDDQSAILAGELLVKEILYNTDDRTGLINRVE